MKRITTDYNSVKTQLDAVMYHLKTEKTLTSMEAIQEYGITRLAEYIRQIRNMGYSITTEDVTNKNRFGNSVTYAKYVYNEPITVGGNGQTQMEI